VTAPPVTELRARPQVIRLGGAGEQVITVRVQIPEVWDVVRIEAPPSVPVALLKQRALNELVPNAENSAEWVTKLGGFEILDENASLIEAGAKNGSTLLVTSRRRRPVR